MHKVPDLIDILLPQQQSDTFLTSTYDIYLLTYNLHLRYPHWFGQDICKTTLRFLATCSEYFFNYEAQQLARLIWKLYLCEKKLKQKISAFPSQRHLFFHILKNSQNNFKKEKNALCILLSINFFNELEFLSQEHIFKVIQNFFPGVKEIPHSSYFYHDRENSTITVYLEIKKARGFGFSPHELKRFREDFSWEMKENVKRLSPPLFIPYNEEEICRNIIHLSEELQEVHDLPQVMLSFHEQQGNILRFTVIALRMCQKNTPSLQTLCKQLPQSIHFTSRQTNKIDSDKNQWVKEANVFSLETDSLPFLRKNHSLDLLEARSYIATALEQMIGPFRDCNGGFFAKQKQQWNLIKNALETGWEPHADHVKNLFQSLKPSIMQVLILPETGKETVALFLNALNQNIPEDDKVLFFKKDHPDFQIALLKTWNKEYRDILSEELKKFTKPNHCARASLEIEGCYYLFSIYQYHEDSLFSFIETLLNQLPRKHFSFKKMKCTLSLNFHEGDPPSLNPHVGVDVRCRFLARSLFEGLVRINQLGFPERAGAKSFTLSPCQTKYIFHLRHMQWSNGEEVTALHFISAWKKALSPGSNCLRTDLFYPIKHAKSVSLGETPPDAIGIRALDRKTLEIELEHPSPHFLHHLAHPIFSPLYDNREEPLVFNGPFVLQSWTPNISMSLTSNPYYWDRQTIQLKGVQIAMEKNICKAFEMFQKKELDLIGNPFSPLPQDKMIDLRNSGELKTKPVSCIYALHCHTGYFPLSSAKIRKALACAINRQTLCKGIFEGQIPCRMLIPPEVSLLEEQELFKEDPEEARRLFQEGLDELQLSKKNFPPLFFLHLAGQEKFGHFLQKSWQETLGIKVTPVETEWNQLSQALDRRHYQIASANARFFCHDSSYDLNYLKNRSNVYNIMEWENVDFQKLLHRAQQANELHEKQERLAEAEKILTDEMPFIPVYREIFHYMLRKDVKGLCISPSGEIDFKWVSFEN